MIADKILQTLEGLDAVDDFLYTLENRVGLDTGVIDITMFRNFDGDKIVMRVWFKDHSKREIEVEDTSGGAWRAW